MKDQLARDSMRDLARRLEYVETKLKSMQDQEVRRSQERELRAAGWTRVDKSVLWDPPEGLAVHGSLSLESALFIERRRKR